VNIVRCHPPRVEDLQPLFTEDVRALAVECQHDVRRILNRLQYGASDTLPQAIALPKHGPEVTEILKQKMWAPTDPLIRSVRGYRADTPGTSNSSETSS
jgi:hypothetical protein